MSSLPTRHQVGMVVLLMVALGGFAYIGSQRARVPAPIVYKPSANPSAPALPAPPSAPAEIVVHVVGAVKKTGVVHAKPGDRVEDAIRMVGGATAKADLDAINLAAKLEDGAQIFVPTKGEPIPESVEPSAPSKPNSEAKPPSQSRSVAPKRSEPSRSTEVHLNTATQAQLESLPGIGPATAKKIIDYRLAHGGFVTIEEIMSVKGIGPKKFEAMRPFLRL